MKIIRNQLQQIAFITLLFNSTVFNICSKQKNILLLIYIFFVTLFITSPASAAVTFRSATSALTTIISSGGITHIGAGTPNARNSCGNITPSIPAGNTNDLLIALAIAKEDDGGNNITMPNWNTYYSATYPGNPPDNNELQVRIYWRIATGGDSNIITQSGSSCNAFAGQISRFRGVDTASPFETATPGVVTQDSNNIDTGTIVTSSTNAMLLVAGFVSDDRSVSEGAGWFESFDYSYSGGALKPDLDVTLNYQSQTTAGTKSISNWSLSGGNTDENFGVIFALKPGGGPASGGLAINVPTGTLANDVMIASVSTAPDTIAITPPAGWTLIRQVTQSNTNSSKLSSYYKVATGTEPANYTWVLSGAGFNGAAGGIASIIGVDTATPYDAEAGTATPSSRDHVAPSVITTLADGMLVTTHQLTSSATWTPPTGMTEMVDTASLTPTDANGISIEMNYEARPTAGATGTRSARSSANAGPNRDYGATQSISLKPYGSTFHHFEIDHDGTALTCNPEQVTIRACNNASCTPPHYASPTDITLSPSGWIGGDTQTIPAGTLTPSLAIRTAGAQLLNITSSTVAPSSGLAATICKNTSTGVTGVIGTAACSLTYSDTGFISTIPTQTSCATSAAITLQAVRLDATTQTCVPAFQNVNRSLKVWTSYSNPAPASIIGTPEVSITNGNGTYILPTSEPVSANVAMSFAGAADETFTLNYPDAGQLILNTKYEGSATNSDTGLTMLGSNTFIVKPAKLYVYSDDVNSTCASNDASCSAFTSASTPFNLKVRAACADNSKTPNFILNNIAVSHTNTTPAVAQGVLGVTSFNMVAGDQGEHVIANQTVSEVGVFTFTGTAPNYLGVTGPAGTSTYIGRFYPHHFDTSVGEGCTIFNNYTYSGQPFSVAATAMNNLSPTPTATQNYTATFAFNTTLSNAAIIPIINFNTTNIIPAIDFTNGMASKLNVAYTFPAKDTIPETITLRANDADTGTSIGVTEGATQIRSGRMRLENVFGPELTPLDMPLRVEYYSDNTLIYDPGDPATTQADDGFILNPDDSCTTYDATAGALPNYTGNLSAGETTVTGAGSTVAGVASINFSAPGAGNEGTVNLLANNVSSWLTYSWNLDCDNADSDNDITTGIDAGLCGPVATTSFGLYRGDDRVIYWREVFN